MCSFEIEIWGDSVARGVIYNEQRERYAISRERCANRLATEAGCRVENHAVMGETAPKGFARFLQSEGTKGAICAIEFGGNDCDLNWASVAENPQEPIRAQVSLDEYARTLRDFITLARQRGMRPVLVTPPPLHAHRYFNWVTRGLNGEAVERALGGDIFHIYRWQERYTLAMRNVAAELRCSLVDVRDAFLAHLNYASLMCIDGIHPNDEGHRVMADACLRALAAVEG